MKYQQKKQKTAEPILVKDPNNAGTIYECSIHKIKYR
jgi:hypothetical protein